MMVLLYLHSVYAYLPVFSLHNYRLWPTIAHYLVVLFTVSHYEHS